jgi:hypothetical protein
MGQGHTDRSSTSLLRVRPVMAARTIRGSQPKPELVDADAKKLAREIGRPAVGAAEAPIG